MQIIYARQSVDKRDSISIETQIEECKKELKQNEEYKIFQDKGYSGKSTKRPDFQAMMQEIKTGNVSRIIIYKLDRISRSLIDFLTMQKTFDKYGVELKSCSEQFDTSGIMGKTIVNILMVFAEMERETIQKRITDNYYARGEKGFYLGGPPPFGYDKIETSLYGKKTYTFAENLEESQIIKSIYKYYIDGKSLSAIARWLNDNNIPAKRKGYWNSNVISRILKNPVYVKANAEIYNYLKSLGATMNNPVDDYVGNNGCYVYGNDTKRKGAKFVNLKTDYVTLGLHKGIIEPSVWLAVQNIFNQKKNHSNLGTGNLTWLQGLVKCRCGYTYYIKRYKTTTKEHRYFYCRGKKYNSCSYNHKLISVDKIERITEKVLLKQLKSLKGQNQNNIIKDTPEINILKIQLAKIDEQIQNIITKIADCSDTTIKYLNEKIENLDKEKKEILNNITNLELKNNSLNKTNIDINDVLKDWYNYDLNTKKQIAKQIIENIILEGNKVEINFY